MTWPCRPPRPAPLGRRAVDGMAGAWVELTLGLLPAVEGVEDKQPADRAVVVGDWLGLRPSVGFGGAGVVVDQVAEWCGVQRGHRRSAPPRRALACALVVMPVAAMCRSWQ